MLGLSIRVGGLGPLDSQTTPVMKHSQSRSGLLQHVDTGGRIRLEAYK
jgi:hypothetical protein